MDRAHAASSKLRLQVSDDQVIPYFRHDYSSVVTEVDDEDCEEAPEEANAEPLVCAQQAASKTPSS